MLTDRQLRTLIAIVCLLHCALSYPEQQMQRRQFNLSPGYPAMGKRGLTDVSSAEESERQGGGSGLQRRQFSLTPGYPAMGKRGLTEGEAPADVDADMEELRQVVNRLYWRAFIARRRRRLLKQMRYSQESLN